MAKQEKADKKIRSMENLRRLRMGDIVEIEEYGKALYYAKSMASHTFLGRRNGGDSIYELEVARGHITPNQNGVLKVGAILSERIYHLDYINNSNYETKNKILIGQGV